MPTFAVEELIEFETDVKVYKLLRDGKCILDDFIKDIENTNLEDEISNLFQVIEDIANGLQHPKFKQLRLSKKCPLAGFEAKSPHLRIYLFRDNLGHIIVCAGKKKTQKKDISRFEKLLKEFNQSRP